MPNEEQKRIWQQEKEQQLRDREKGQVTRKREVPLSLGGKPRRASDENRNSRPAGKDQSAEDSFLRRWLGI